MRRSKWKAVLIIAVLWALALVLHDKWFDIHSVLTSRVVHAAATDMPEVWIRLEGRECTGGMEGVRRAIQAISWLGDAVVVEESKQRFTGIAYRASADSSCEKMVKSRVRSMVRADFAELTQTLHKYGVYPSELHLGYYNKR